MEPQIQRANYGAQASVDFSNCGESWNQSPVDIMGQLYYMVWMYHSVFIHSPTEGHLGCFQGLAIMNKAAINIHVQVFMWALVFTSFG